MTLYLSFLIYKKSNLSKLQKYENLKNLKIVIYQNFKFCNNSLKIKF